MKVTPPSPQPNNDLEDKPEEEEIIARAANNLSIHLGEHCGIVGATNAGKTYFTMRGLLEYLRKQYPKAKRYILDSTDDPDMIKMVYNPLQVTGNHRPDLLRDASRTLIWTPTNSKLPSAYNEWFEMLNDAREPQIIVIDEAASITGEALEGLEGLCKQLRKHGGTIIVESQEIGGVDTTIFKQLSHYFQFFISNETYDLSMSRKYLAIAKEDQRQPLHTHGFFHRKTRTNIPMKEYRDMKEFFGESIY